MSQPETLPTTRLAVLRTIGTLHTGLHYDLATLRDLVMRLSPDLLCADITRQAWESGDLTTAPLEVRDALVPAIAMTDTVLVPVGPDASQFSDYQASPGWRDRLARFLDRALRWGQRKVGRVESIHGMPFEAFCHAICVLEEVTWRSADRTDYHARMQALAANILAAIRRDPGGRVLAVVQCQWQHALAPLLKQQSGDWLQIVDYREL